MEADDIFVSFRIRRQPEIMSIVGWNRRAPLVFDSEVSLFARWRSLPQAGIPR